MFKIDEKYEFLQVTKELVEKLKFDLLCEDSDEIPEFPVLSNSYVVWCSTPEDEEGKYENYSRTFVAESQEEAEKIALEFLNGITVPLQRLAYLDMVSPSNGDLLARIFVDELP